MIPEVTANLMAAVKKVKWQKGIAACVNSFHDRRTIHIILVLGVGGVMNRLLHFFIAKSCENKLLRMNT